MTPDLGYWARLPQAIIFNVIYLIAFSGCVTFNSLDFEKSIVANNHKPCLNLEFKVLDRGLSGNENNVVALEKMRLNQVVRTLKNLKIDAACTSADVKNLVVMANDKTSLAMPFFFGITSVFTVLSLGIIPSYYSGHKEIILMDGDKQLLSREYSFSTAIWLPFAIKQWQDDSKGFDLYEVDARSAILGLEIGKLLVEYAAIEKEK